MTHKAEILTTIVSQEQPTKQQIEILNGEIASLESKLKTLNLRLNQLLANSRNGIVVNPDEVSSVQNNINNIKHEIAQKEQALALWDMRE